MTDLSTQAAQLSVQVEGLSGSVTALARKQRRDRALLVWVFAGLCVSLVALVLVGFVAVRANNAAKDADAAHTLAESNKAAAQLTCEAGNQSRATQVQLWSYVLTMFAGNNNTTLTPEQRQRLAEFHLYVQQVFKPRDCTKPVAPTTPVPSPTGTR